MSQHPSAEQERASREAIEAELTALGSTYNPRTKKWKCPNPAHDDANPSASVHAKDHVYRVHCFACDYSGDVFDLRAMRTGTPVADQLRAVAQAEPVKVQSMKQIAKRYFDAIKPEALADLSAKLGVSVEALVRLRVGWCERDKAYSFPMRNESGGVCGIRLRRMDGGKHSEKGGNEGLFVPVELSPIGPLVVTEGPTDCAAAVDMGLDAVGRPNNSSRTPDEMIAAMIQEAARDEVWIIHDNDDNEAAKVATITAAHRLAARLVGAVRNVRIFAPPSPHKDLRAWRNAGATSDDIDAAALAATPHGPAQDLSRMLEQEIDGTRSSISLPWGWLSTGTQALLPGTVTLLAGDPGATKSLAVLQMLAHWKDHGVNAAVYMLEESREYHLRRALAQVSRCSEMTDLSWVKEHPDIVRRHAATYASEMNALGRMIDAAPDKPVKLADLLKWVEEKAAAGARVMVIDPVTAADAGERPWDADRAFIQTVKPVLDTHGASLILVTHPRKGRKPGPVSMDDMAGSAALQRFSQTVIWLERPDEPRDVVVKQYGMSFSLHPVTNAVKSNRTVKILKARNGRGAGWTIGMHFDGLSLTLSEQGVIETKSRTMSRRDDDEQEQTA